MGFGKRRSARRDWPACLEGIGAILPVRYLYNRGGGHTKVDLVRHRCTAVIADTTLRRTTDKFEE